MTTETTVDETGTRFKKWVETVMDKTGADHEAEVARMTAETHEELRLDDLTTHDDFANATGRHTGTPRRSVIGATKPLVSFGRRPLSKRVQAPR